MLVRMKVTFVPEVGEDGRKLRGWESELRDPTDARLRHELQIMQYNARAMRDKLIVDDNATAAGMSRLVSGDNVKDTVKYGRR